MGTIHAEIELRNQADESLAGAGHLPPARVRVASVRALVDTGATSLVIPESLRRQLGLGTVAKKLAARADGTVLKCDLVGPIEVRFGGRVSIGTAIAMPDPAQVLLGALQMEDMDLLPDPGTQRLIVNPESPDRARVLAVGVRVFVGDPEGRNPENRPR